MPVTPARVIKLGGSLLDLPELASRLADWLADQPARRNVVIVGGGKTVKLLRRWAGLRQWSAEKSHWAAIRVMGINARRLVREAGNWQLAEELESLPAVASTVLIDPLTLLRRWHQLDPTVLPASWDVTSDSIAAQFAQQLNQAELVLLKSVDGSAEQLDLLRRRGVIDSYFQQAARGLSVRIVNLRRSAAASG